MLLSDIKNCDLSEEDKLNLNLILEDFVKNYYQKEIKMLSTAAKNLLTMEICRLYEQGWSVKQIAQKYNCTTNSITKHLAKGGYSWNKCQLKWIKAQPVSQTSTSQLNLNLNTRKNRQADVVTWLLSGAYQSDTITTDILAKKFGCTSDQASGYLTGISKKGILGMKKVGRKLYKFNQVSYSETTSQENNPVAMPEKTRAPYVKPESSEDFTFTGADVKKISEFARSFGGLENLQKITGQIIDIKKID